METLRSNANKMTDYPNKETMKLFLEVGYKTKLFDSIKDSDGNLWYKSVNAVVTLAIICDYLCQHGREQEKQSFLDEVEKNDKTLYKRMGEFALDIRESKGNIGNFSKAMIIANRKRLQNVDSDIRCFPTIADRFSLPERIDKIEGRRMIHKEFEAELARLNGISKGADRIQAETKNHKFKREDNSKKINDLENRL